MTFNHKPPRTLEIDISFIDFQSDPFLGKEDNYFTYPNFYSMIVRNAINKPNYKFVEIGAWKGRSAAYMGAEIEFHSRFYRDKYKISLDTIDTFEGSEEHQELLKDEEESLYDICKKQIEPVCDYVNIIKGDSVETSSRYEDESLDFVFIDGDHSYEGVTRDIKAYWPKVKVGGVISGHDYEGGWVDCKKAVDDFFGDSNLGLLQNNEQHIHLYSSPMPISGVHAAEFDSNDKPTENVMLHWPAGELCWGVRKTSSTGCVSILSQRGYELIKVLCEKGHLWMGFNKHLEHAELISLYDLEGF
jgi:hypothetical protein